MSSISVNGQSFEYVERGRGEPLIFVHGSLEDYRSWRLQMEPFSAHYRVIAYSRRFHYPNPWPAGGPANTGLLHAEDLAALIRGLGLGPVHLVCSSFGGVVALVMASRQPELVRSLVLAEPPLLPWLERLPGGPPLLAAFLEGVWEPARRAFAAGDLEQGVCLFMAGVMGRPVCDRPPRRDVATTVQPHTALGVLARRGMVMDNARALQSETESPDFFPALSCGDLAAVDRPALLLRAQLSPPLFGLILDELAACLPRSGRAVIPRTSHAMHLGNPQAYNDIVLSFLAAL